jgi:hypothetical protein
LPPLHLPGTSAREVIAVTLLEKPLSHLSSHLDPSILPVPNILPSRLSSSASHQIMAHSFQHMSEDEAAPIQGGNSPFAPQGMGNQSPPPSSSFAAAARNATFDFQMPSQSTPNRLPPQTSRIEVPSQNTAYQYPLQDSSFEVSARNSSFGFTVPSQGMAHAIPSQITLNEFPPQHMRYAGPLEDVASTYQPRPPQTPQPKAKGRDPRRQDTPESVVAIPKSFLVGRAILTRTFLPKP